MILQTTSVVPPENRPVWKPFVKERWTEANAAMKRGFVRESDGLAFFGKRGVWAVWGEPEHYEYHRKRERELLKNRMGGVVTRRKLPNGSIMDNKLTRKRNVPPVPKGREWGYKDVSLATTRFLRSRGLSS